MATSSIFHNVILNEPKQVEAFINALEASEADPYGDLQVAQCQ